MRVEVVGAITAYIAVAMAGMDTPELVMITVDRLVFVLAVNALTNLHVRRAAMRGLQVAHLIGMAAVTGEAVTGIHPMDFSGSRAWAMSIHITGFGITVTLARTVTDIGPT